MAVRPSGAVHAANRTCSHGMPSVVLLSDWRFPDAPLYHAATFGEAAPFWFEPALDVAMRFPYVGCMLQSPPGSPAPGIVILINLPADEVSTVMQSLADAAAC